MYIKENQKKNMFTSTHLCDTLWVIVSCKEISYQMTQIHTRIAKLSSN